MSQLMTASRPGSKPQFPCPPSSESAARECPTRPWRLALLLLAVLLVAGFLALRSNPTTPWAVRRSLRQRNPLRSKLPAFLRQDSVKLAGDGGTQFISSSPSSNAWMQRAAGKHASNADIDPQLASKGREHILVRPDGRRLSFVIPDCHAGTSLDLASMIISRGGIAVVASPHYHSEWLQSQGRKDWAQRWIPMDGSRSFPHFLLCPEADKTNTAVVQRQAFDYYKNDVSIIHADAFLCAFPSALCEAFLSLNKSLIFAPAWRFSFKRCTERAWIGTIRLFQKAAKSHNPKHFVAAMSRYDAEYLEYYTGLIALPLFSSSRAYTPRAEKFSPSRPEILVGPLTLTLDNAPFRGLNVSFIKALIARQEFHFATAKSLYDDFKLSQLLAHRACVVLPYAVMSYGMTELYALGIPLFFPSAKLMREYPDLYPKDRTVTGHKSYCGEEKRFEPQKYAGSAHTQSPESLSNEAKFYWLKYSDYHQWPHITFFDSIDDLIRKLASSNLRRIHELMLKEVAQKEVELDKVWRTISSGLDAEPRAVPDKFLKFTYP